MEEIEYFWDSYAVIELLDGNKNYAKYSRESVTITIFNLAEIYWSALNEYSEEEAGEIYDKYKDAVVELDDETLKEAVKFRKLHKKRDISYTDSIGYIYAKRNGLKFLTGDRQFEGMENVEFAK